MNLWDLESITKIWSARSVSLFFLSDDGFFIFFPNVDESPKPRSGASNCCFWFHAASQKQP